MLRQRKAKSDAGRYSIPGGRFSAASRMTDVDDLGGKAAKPGKSPTLLFDRMRRLAGAKLLIGLLATVLIGGGCGGDSSPRPDVSGGVQATAEKTPQIVLLTPIATPFVAAQVTPTPIPAAGSQPGSILEDTSRNTEMETECASPLLGGNISGPFGESEDEARQFFEAFVRRHGNEEAGTDLEVAAALTLQCHLRDLGYATIQQDFKSYTQQSVNLSANGEASGSLETGRYLAIVNSAEGEAEGALVHVGQALEANIPPSGLTGRVALIERGTITSQEKA